MVLQASTASRKLLQNDTSADVTVQFYGGSASQVTAIATDLNTAASDGDLAVCPLCHALHAGQHGLECCLANVVLAADNVQS